MAVTLLALWGCCNADVDTVLDASVVPGDLADVAPVDAGEARDASPRDSGLPGPDVSTPDATPEDFKTDGACSRFAQVFCDQLVVCEAAIEHHIGYNHCFETDYDYCILVNPQPEIPLEMGEACFAALDPYECYQGYPDACSWAEFGVN